MRCKGYLMLLVAVAMTILLPAAAAAEDGEAVMVKIADPFINLRTGPGSAYPIFYVIDRGEMVTIEKRRTEWFKIRSRQGKTGWASREEMQQTLLPGGEAFQVRDEAEAQDFVSRQWSYGVSGGELDRAPVFTVFSAYSFTENLSGEFSYSESSASFSSSNSLKAALLMQPFPEWTASPFFALGAGRIKVESGATLISANRQESTMAQVGMGFHYYLSRRFVFRFEVNEYVILSANNAKDDNEETGEWKTGFSVFF